jgi:predicted transcriptional regulator
MSASLSELELFIMGFLQHLYYEGVRIVYRDQVWEEVEKTRRWRQHSVRHSLKYLMSKKLIERLKNKKSYALTQKGLRIRCEKHQVFKVVA